MFANQPRFVPQKILNKINGATAFRQYGMSGWPDSYGLNIAPSCEHIAAANATANAVR